MFSCDLPGIPKLRSGKVREVFDLDDRLLIVATDRISAFDCILPDPIPGKGAVLNRLSERWFSRFPELPNHLITANVGEFPQSLEPYRDTLRDRSMIVKRTEPLPVECVVRGYLAGSGWKEYQASGTVCGVPLPTGLRSADKLPEPIFTPATKADTGHDENIDWQTCVKILGEKTAERVRELSLLLYTRGSAFAAGRGIIIADTKFEFGVIDDEIILIDECMTPDSSRFWPSSSYHPGSNPPSFDKQFVRDYLETLDWNKTPPAPSLPADVIARTAAKYAEAFDRLG
ncbi:MAG TPA: phosphoribosylaminoimidazolesuccinocarboxamide synthase [Chthoniobacterales bacterium]